MAEAASERLISSDLRFVEVQRTDPPDLLATGSQTLTTYRGLELGLWEAGPGTDTDVEVHEIFLVLEGEGTVEFVDGSAIELRPGVLVKLFAGDHTRWVVHQRIRKLYLA